MSRQLYIIGGGIAGLASAVFAIRDGGLCGDQVTIFDDADRAGGSLDAAGDATIGYFMRGERMLSRHFVCLYDLLSGIPSYDDRKVSACDDIFAFTRASGWESKARLVRKDGSKIDVSHLELDGRDRIALLRLMLRSEVSLSNARIADLFTAHFFTTNFWLMWCTMFAFQPWHSAIEMRRYLRRFLHLFPHLASMRTVHRTRYDQYHAIVVPLLRWLEAKGVRLMERMRVTELELAKSGAKARVMALQVQHDDRISERFTLEENDAVILCNGSMTAGSTNGSSTEPPSPMRSTSDWHWRLWQQIASGRGDFGKPEAFCGDPEKSKFVSFTATTRSSLLPELLEGMTHAPTGREGLITFADSNWLLTIKANPTPHFPGQPADTTVWWGYGLKPDAPGNFTGRRMTESSGADILCEAFGHLGFAHHMDALMSASMARPCLMPFITSQFMPRAPGDRPQVLPKRSANLAFVGQFCEVPYDTVFTVEYSVRSAMMAVKGLLHLNMTIPPIYKGWRKPGVILRAVREALR